jgi:exodeoxyribonuclease VII small subunit
MEEAKTFRESYEVLQRHAATLREQDEPNIDDLLDIVNESVAAYKVCKQRIDAVEKALEEALVGAGLDGNARASKAAATPPADAGTRPAKRPSAKGLDDDADDIPF